MKIKHVITTLALAGMLGAGAFAGIKASGVAREARAGAAGTTSDWKYVGSGQGNGWNEKSTASNLYLTFTNQSSSVHSWKRFTFVANEQFKLMTGTSWGTDLGWSYVKFGDAVSGNFTYDGTNIKCVNPGTYDVCVGWNGTENRIGIYASGTLSNNLETKNVYVLEKPNDSGYWVPSKVYAFGGLEQFNSFDTNTPIPDSASPTVNLAGQYGNIKAIEYLPLAGDNKFIIHNGSGYQSTDTTFSAGSAYYYGSKDSKGKVVLTASANLGLAADFITRAEAKRNAASYMTHDYSICGIDPQDAADLWNEYNAITDANLKKYIDDTTVETYKGKDADGNYDWNKTSVSYANIMLQLKAIAIAGNKTVNGGNELTINNPHTANYAPVIIVVSSIAVVSILGAGLMIKRRKEDR